MKIWNEVLKIILIFIILICIYFLALRVVSSIPSSWMKNNVKESADFIMEQGGDSQIINLPYKFVNIFNFTNSLMINTAYSIDNKSPIESFLTARKNYIPGVTTTIYTETPKDLISASKYYENGIPTNEAYPSLELKDTVYENDLYESFEYARYWHGYLVYLRPLLCLFNYEQIQVISTIIFVVLLGVTSYFLWKNIGKLFAIGLIISCFLCDLFFIAKSINEIICFDIALVFSIYILCKKDIDWKKCFFICGSITNFLDFLTNPIVTYGIPIIIYFLKLLNDEKLDNKQIFLIYLKTAILWGVGYLLTWVTKWVIVDLILDRGIVKNALEQAMFRTHGTKIACIEFIKRMTIYVSANVLYLLLFEVIGMVIFSIVKKRYKNYRFDKLFAYSIGLIIHIAWYIVLEQHSYVHMFFTYRGFVVAIFALQVILIEIYANTPGGYLGYRVNKGVDTKKYM